ncbi:MAG: tetraacyldisaccharide 4'-kinase, partial [Acidiferrobacteraceae bacterium]|nr:tetraacyldisaccharide 4'-kinase [Acidiferrobacteraceae bacterium]
MNVAAGLQRHWNRIDALTLLLLPLSICYGLIISIRALLYQLGVFRVQHWNVPVLVVGNLTVGGSGKTPLVIELARGLRARGWRPGVVSRGYGGTSEGPTTVTAATDPFLVGDEPVLIAREAEVPVVVARKRAKAVDRLLQEAEVNLVIADDGLQHLALGRVVEIAVIDGVTGHGNGLLLPAGPLREPLRRLERVDIRVRRGGQPKEGEYPMSVNASVARNLVSGQEVELSEFSGVPVVAVA